MRVIGLTKVRNEEEIMEDTLKHWGQYCTGGIYVYDDVSTDKTVDICEQSPHVKQVIKGEFWDPDREKAEWVNRQAVLDAAIAGGAEKDDWFVYFDADERFYPGQDKYYNFIFDLNVDAIACKLFDIYITPQDKDKHYKERDYVGPEYRTIIMFFRNREGIGYNKPDQRIVDLPQGSNVVVSGYIKHYGKGLSVKHWEDTCDYYINHWPKYSEKWKARKGKAVKENYLSDFNNPLISFRDVISGKSQGISLESQVYGRN